MGAIQPYFDHPTFWMSTFQAYYSLDLKSKVVSLNGKTLDIYSNLNPICHGSHLTLF